MPTENAIQSTSKGRAHFTRRPPTQKVSTRGALPSTVEVSQFVYFLGNVAWELNASPRVKCHVLNNYKSCFSPAYQFADRRRPSEGNLLPDSMLQGIQGQAQLNDVTTRDQLRRRNPTAALTNGRCHPPPPGHKNMELSLVMS